MTRIDEVCQLMQAKILSQAWKPEQRLPSEAEMCRIFGVSRATIRSCIQRFCQQGVMETVNGSGTFLRGKVTSVPLEQYINLVPVDRESLLYLLEVRQPLEMQAAFFAAQRRSQGQVAELKKILDRLLATRDAISFAEEDEKFHLYMVGMADNPIIVRLYKTLQKYTSDFFLKQTISLFQTPEQLDYNGHRRIFQAIQAGEAEQARQACYDHIQTTIERVQEKL